MEIFTSCLLWTIQMRKKFKLCWTYHAEWDCKSSPHLTIKQKNCISNRIIPRITACILDCIVVVKLVQYPGGSVGGAPDSRSWRVVLDLNSSLVWCMISLLVTPGLKIILKLRIVQCSLDLVKKILSFFFKTKSSFWVVWTYFIGTIKWSESQFYRNEQ